MGEARRRKLKGMLPEGFWREIEDLNWENVVSCDCSLNPTQGDRCPFDLFGGCPREQEGLDVEGLKVVN